MTEKWSVKLFVRPPRLPTPAFSGDSSSVEIDKKVSTNIRDRKALLHVAKPNNYQFYILISMIKPWVLVRSELPKGPAGLATPPLESRHRVCQSPERHSDPGAGQIPRARSSFQEVFRGREQRIEVPDACASEGVSRGHVDLLLPQQVTRPKQGQPLPQNKVAMTPRIGGRKRSAKMMWRPNWIQCRGCAE